MGVGLWGCVWGRGSKKPKVGPISILQCPKSGLFKYSSGREVGPIYIHSSKLIWKWRGAHYNTGILYLGPSMSFYLNLGEVIEEVGLLW